MAAALLMLGSFDAEVAHLAFDHAGIAAVASRWVDLGGDFGEEEPVVIIVVGQGEKSPVSRFWIG